jgi:hypothetical protein
MGRGYWLDVPVDTAFDVVGMELDSASLQLHTGFNVIGNPFPVDLLIADLMFDNGIETKTYAEAVTVGWIAANIFGFNASGYLVEPTSLEVWHGYWLEVLVPGVTLRYYK